MIKLIHKIIKIPVSNTESLLKFRKAYMNET